jgi:alpha-N-arabinofuranosidase
MYGGWQLGHMSTEMFVDKHNDFTDAMKSVDDDIVIVAVGDLGKWDEMMLTHCSDHMDLISEHFYRQDWHGGGLMTHITQIPQAIEEKALAHRKYRKEIPGLEGKDIRICLDEWNYWYGPHIYGELGTRYYMRDGLGVAAGINEFSRQSDMIFMANYAQTVNVIGAIKATTTQSVMASTGKALSMYRKYFGSIPVEISGETRPLDIAATVTQDHKYLTVSIVNLSWESQTIPLEFEGSDKFDKMEIITLAASSDMAYNVPGQEESVWITEPKEELFSGELKIDPIEARIYRFALKK